MFNTFFSLFGVFLVTCLFQVSRTCDDDTQGDLVQNSVIVDSPKFPLNPWLPYYYYTPMPMQYPTGNQDTSLTAYMANQSFLLLVYLNEEYHNSAVATRSNPAFVPFASCTTPNKETGICAESGACTRGGGRVSGSCNLGRVCCVSKYFRRFLLTLLFRAKLYG